MPFWLKPLSPVASFKPRVLSGWPVFLRAFGLWGMFPAESAALTMTRVADMKEFYGMSDGLWNAFVAEAGDPADDLRLLAALPGEAVAASLDQAMLNGHQPLSGPGGVNVEIGKKDHVHSKRRGLEHLAGRRSMDFDRSIITNRGGHEGPEIEVITNHRSRGRQSSPSSRKRRRGYGSSSMYS